MSRLFKMLACVLLLISSGIGQAQDPHRFDAKIAQLLTKSWQEDGELPRVIFTGSSSIVRWEELESLFPDHDVKNFGFGGSQFSDLIHFYDELIKRQSPDILFIYEGDNDMARGKEPAAVFAEVRGLIARIRSDLPQTRIVLIAPKPCIANWAKRENYRQLNALLADLCTREDQLDFADVWSAMVDDNGVVFQDIFVADGDHMNAKGYGIWKRVISPFLE